VVHAGTAEEEKDAGYTHILHNGPEKDKSKKLSTSLGDSRRAANTELFGATRVAS